MVSCCATVCVAECGLDPRDEQGRRLAELVARVADDVAFVFERRGEHRVEHPPEPDGFVVGLLGNSSRTAATPRSPATPGSICAAWPRQAPAGLRADRASG